MNKAREIIRECQRIIRSDHSYNRYSYYCVNVAKNIQRQLELFTYLNGQLDVLKQCVNEYVEKKGSDDYKTFLKEWLQYGLTLLTDRIEYQFNSFRFYIDYSISLPPDVQDIWPLFYKDYPFNKYIISYPKTLETVELIRKKDTIANCEDKDIRNIHENKECIDIDMFGCMLCEDVEHRWHNTLINSYRKSKYLFINPQLNASFVNDWVEENPTYNEFKFPPTKCYDINWASTSCHSKIVTDYKIALINAVESRSHYMRSGKTPLECLESYTVQQTIESSLSRIKLDKATDFELFMYLWNHLDLYHIYIKLDSERCKEMLEML
jgi:hypothetical protein